MVIKFLLNSLLACKKVKKNLYRQKNKQTHTPKKNLKHKPASELKPDFG